MSQELTPARKANIEIQKKVINNHFLSRNRLSNMNRKITSVQRDEVIRRRYEGESPKDLALEFGITANYIMNLAPWNARSSYGA